GRGAHGLHAPPDRTRGPRLRGEPEDRRVQARAPARAHGGDGRRGRARARDPAAGAARMTGRIRDEAIRTVRERASLSEVVSDVIALRDRKSTRLNSSHVSISYAVFCLKKKKRDAAGV